MGYGVNSKYMQYKVGVCVMNTALASLDSTCMRIIFDLIVYFLLSKGASYVQKI